MDERIPRVLGMIVAGIVIFWLVSTLLTSGVGLIQMLIGCAILAAVLFAVMRNLS
jgi:hypothetical protein